MGTTEEDLWIAFFVLISLCFGFLFLLMCGKAYEYFLRKTAPIEDQELWARSAEPPEQTLPKYSYESEDDINALSLRGDLEDGPILLGSHERGPILLGSHERGPNV